MTPIRVLRASSLEGELERLQRADIPAGCRTKIRQFIEDRKVRGLSDVRCYNLSVRLRKIAGIIPGSFLNPSEEDTKHVIQTISSTTIIMPRWSKDKGEKIVTKVTIDRLPSVNTMESYKLALRSFYKWLLENDRHVPECVEWIKIGKKDRYQKPKNLITPEEVAKIIDFSRNARDRAMFQLLYDSGIRMGELLTLRVRDLEWKPDYGLVAKVSGKTGYRDVIVVGDSVVLLRKWLDNHPLPNRPDAFVFTRLNEKDIKRPMIHNDVYRALNDATDRAGIRRVNPHLFRHTRATLLASDVAEAPLEKQMGWVHGSDMTRVYVHLSRRDQEDAILKAYGIERPDGKKHLREPRPSACPRCGEQNTSGATYCGKCWLPLTPGAAQEFKVKQDRIQAELTKSGNIKGEVQSYLERLSDTERTAILTLIVEDLIKTKGQKQSI